MKDKHKLTKVGISEAVYNKIGYSRKFSEELVVELFEYIKNYLIKGQGIKIHGFGKFVLKDKKPRKGRNPKTGRTLVISARRVLLFHTSTVLKKRF